MANYSSLPSHRPLAPKSLAALLRDHITLILPEVQRQFAHLMLPHRGLTAIIFAEAKYYVVRTSKHYFTLDINTMEHKH